jgi:hypothetical protein
MSPVNVAAFGCSFCGKKSRLYRSRTGARRHERLCFDNPARRACRTCRFYGFDSSEDDAWNFCDHKSGDWLKAADPLDCAKDRQFRWECPGHEREEIKV